MQLERPRFRQDLVAELVEDGNHRFIDLMDPDSGNVYRFYEVEYSLACAMDGERDVPGIVRWAQEELGLQANPNEVKSVIATLGDLGYLDGAAPAARPETPAQRPVVDEELGRGVVVGSKRVNTPVPGLELGHAGASSHAASSRAEAPVADVELAAGVTTGRSATPQRAKVEDIALGTPGRADVSVDLADQIGVSANDVKEAVRASKVMNAVEVPADLQHALDSAEAAPAKTQKKPPPTPAKGVPAVDTKAADAAKAEAEKAAAAAKAADAAKAEAARQAAEAEKAAAAAKAAAAKAKPVEKQKQPEAKAAIAPPAPAPSVSRGLLIVLAIVAIGAIAFLVYKFVLAKHGDETAETAPPPPKPQPPQPPPPPPVESEKLATNAPQSESIKPVAAGTIEMIAANDAKVKEGDTLARFTGAKALATEIAALDKDIEQRVKTELFKAQQERDAAIAADNKAAQTTAEARVADRQKSLDDKQGKLSTKKADLDKLEIKSPADGTFTAKAKAGAKVTPTDEIGMLVRAPTRTVTFKKADGAPKSKVLLVTKDGQKLSCIVTSVDAAGSAIACPEDAAPEGTEVTFGGLDNTPPPVSPDQNNSGSGAGSAAAGSGAGSAAPAAVPSPAPTRPTPPARPAPARPAPKATPKADKTDKPAETPPADKGSSEAAPAPAGSSDTPPAQ